MKKIILFAAFLILVSVNSIKANPGFRFGVTFNYFYSSLSPYGEWIEIDNDFYAWRPYHNHRNWMPYSVGRWIWTNQGWYWDSYEPYGWATYHYGRWYNDDYYGWIWVPDYDWAPAWVEWRYNDDYIGWAPLPPYATWRINFGIHFSINWHSPYHYWNFVHYNHFCGYDIDRYVVGEKYRNRIYSNTKYRNDYGYKDDRIINRGIERDFIERRSGNKIVERDMVETTRLRDNMATRNKDDRRIEVYRPSDDDIKRTREISKYEVKRNDRKTSLEVSKVGSRERTGSENKSVDVKLRDREVNKSTTEKVIKPNRDIRYEENRVPERKTETEKNVNRNDNRTIEKKKEVEKRSEPNVNRSIEKNTGVNKIEKPNREIVKQPQREVGVKENNKPRNESPRIESRTQEKRNVDIRERRNVEEKRIEPKREKAPERNSRSTDNDKIRRK
jgi:hypothetical protein